MEINENSLKKFIEKMEENNWLKLHGKPMRRKPFKREAMMMLDEFWMIH